LLGTIELSLFPLRLVARLIGGLLLLVAVVGVPAWLIQVSISLLGGGGGGGPLPAWAMVLLLGAAIPAGILALQVATIAGPLSRAGRRGSTISDDDAEGEWDDPDPEDEPEPESDRSASSDCTQPLAWAYQVLELDPSASATDIKVAYRRLAQLYHPDHNLGFTQQAAERFAEINAAYEAVAGEG